MCQKVKGCNRQIDICLQEDCNGKLHKIVEEQDNKYHCPKCQMDFILDSFEVTITYQYEKSNYPYKKNENEPKKHRLAEYVGN